MKALQQLTQAPLSVLRGTLTRYCNRYLPSPLPTKTYRQMSSKPKSGIPHQVRTAAEPRQNRLYTVRLSHIEQVNPTVRLLQLSIPPHVQSLESEVEQDGVFHSFFTLSGVKYLIEAL